MPLSPWSFAARHSPSERMLDSGMAWPEPLHMSTPKLDGNGFQVCLDVQHFSPDEISVKTVGRQVVVEAKHEERLDLHGHVYRHFLRKYNLPEGFEPHRVVSCLSPDGVLTVMAPGEPITLADKNERIVPIQRAGPSPFTPLRVHHEPPPRRHPYQAHHHRQEPEYMLAIKYI